MATTRPQSFPVWTHEDDPAPQWAEEVRALARQRDAVILAHNYQLPVVQDVADHVGDSLALSRIAAQVRCAEIVFCGVHFMAETAKILAPDKRVLIPDAAAGCSLAATITADQLRAWKAEHPGAVVVAYVNTTAEVKAESDVCCTSSNAVDVVASIPAGTEVLFLPDRHLGAHVARITGRDLHIWDGQCHVHEDIGGEVLARAIADDPDADVLVHPECACATSALEMAASGVIPPDRVRIVSTGGMLDEARRASVDRVLVATEVGMLHQLRRANAGVRFDPVDPWAVCPYMKMITPSKVLAALRDGRDEVQVDPAVAARARGAVERMIALGTSPGASAPAPTTTTTGRGA
ncbi:MAG: quinolinate synthase NadA [Cellulomonas sp.]|jgi:quinolinate synthase|nr:quinolinate synthase NadA [Cellulomonas sp.]